MKLQDRFLKIRNALGYSTVQMSEAIGCSHSLWSQYEAGRKTPSFETLVTLNRLGVSLDWLASGRGPMLVHGKKKRKQSQPILPTILEQVEAVIAETTADWLQAWETLIEALHQSPGLTYEELSSLPDLPPVPSLQHELEQMKSDGLIGEVKGKFYLIRTLVRHDNRVAELKILTAIRDLCKHHLAAIRDGGKTTRIDIADMKMQGGQAVASIRQLWRAIESWRDKAPSSPNGQGSVRLLISTVAFEHEE